MHRPLSMLLAAAVMLAACAPAVPAPAPEPTAPAPLPTSTPMRPGTSTPPPATASATPAPTLAPAVRPTTPPNIAAVQPVAPAGTPVKQVRVIFVGGIDTDSRTLKASFSAITQGLERVGRIANEFVWYSYGGHRFNAGSGTWDPAPYTCDYTRQPLSESVRVLRVGLEELRSARPDIEPVIIGHSLGGLVAALGAPPDVPVITLDAPMHRLRVAAKFMTKAFQGCASGRLDVLNDLSDDYLVPPRPTMLNVANRLDCVYNTQQCPGIWQVLLASAGGCLLGYTPACGVGLGTAVEMRDETTAQVTGRNREYWGTTPRANSIAASHGAILHDPGAIEAVVQYVQQAQMGGSIPGKPAEAPQGVFPLGPVR